MAFSQEEIMAKIVEIINAEKPVTMDTVISEHEDLDSLSMFNIFRFFRSEGLKVNFEGAAKCKTVKELVELIDKAQQ